MSSQNSATGKLENLSARRMERPDVDRNHLFAALAGLQVETSAAKSLAYFEMRLALTVALFNLLQQWNGLNFDENGVSHLSLAEFSL